MLSLAVHALVGAHVRHFERQLLEVIVVLDFQLSSLPPQKTDSVSAPPLVCNHLPDMQHANASAVIALVSVHFLAMRAGS